jgi:hypothetical protein
VASFGHYDCEQLFVTAKTLVAQKLLLEKESVQGILLLGGSGQQHQLTILTAPYANTFH